MNPSARPAAERFDLVERLADEMAARWAAGERPAVEEYLDRFPELRRARAEAIELIAEEIALRQEHGLAVSAADLVERFPAWEAQVRALVTCQQVLGPRAAVFPQPGDVLGDFRLASELGRGAHGRVYLATQSSLGRPVALKLAPAGGREHLSLARLQHTHIVPLYSVHEFPEYGLRGLCHPYFGGVTLDRLPPGPLVRSGSELLAAARQTAGANPALPAPSAPHYLEGLSPADAVCWIGACLADALQYAHDHGLLHLDVKPSNVLLAGDGVPMLLDFHLARSPLRAGDAPPQWLGGTREYMPPEQAAAVEAVRTGTAIPVALDGRADVYALGAVLVELLGGPDGVRTLAPRGLADVLARCAAPDPAERYPSAGALAADLRRHLSDLPLRGVANRSLAERWRKWRRRRPASLPLLLAFAAALAIATALFLRADRQADGARAALDRGAAQIEAGHFGAAAETLRGGEALLDGVPFRGDLRRRLRDARETAERSRVAEELHAVCEQVRPLYDAESLPPDRARAVGARCRQLWERRTDLVQKLDRPTSAGARLCADLLDLAVIAAHLEVVADGTPEARHRALTTLAEAEALLGPAAVLDFERARHFRALGQGERADECRRRAAGLPARTAWEHLVVGRAALASGDRAGAEEEMERALALDPACFWAHYHRGTCRLRAGDPAEALAAFSACAALAPGRAWCLHNRGLAYAALGRLDAARADFGLALALDPGLTAAYLGRGAVNHRAGRHAEALDDLRRAAGEGAAAPEVEYQRAIVFLSQNDREAAIAGLRACLAADPNHAPARELLTRLTAEQSDGK